MKKTVNIYPNGPIVTINPPIRTKTIDMYLPVSDIRKCLLAGAYVEEVLNSGKIIQLNLNNYDKDNNPVVKQDKKPQVPEKKVEEPKEEPKVEEKKPEPVEVKTEETKVEEPKEEPKVEEKKPAVQKYNNRRAPQSTPVKNTKNS